MFNQATTAEQFRAIIAAEIVKIQQIVIHSYDQRLISELIREIDAWLYLGRTLETKSKEQFLDTFSYVLSAFAFKN